MYNEENKNLKRLLDEILHEHFNKFMDVKINNITFQVMPVGKDIPIITKAFYDKSSDFLEIILNNNGNNLVEKNLGEITVIFNDDDDLVGVRIHKFKNIVYTEIKKIIEQNQKIKTNVRSKEIEKRKYSFFSDILNSPLIDKLVY